MSVSLVKHRPVSLVKHRASYTLAPTDVEVTYDNMGREVIVIPDEIALAMNAEIRHGWREIPDVADGYSRPFSPDHWMFKVTSMIMATYAASPVPELCEQFDERDRESAVGRRHVAAHPAGPQMIVFIVGRGDWNADARWWRDYPANKDLHVQGNPYAVTGRDVHFDPVDSDKWDRTYIRFGG